jgi:tetratricopeptide (TPR) repeat protein
VRFTRKLLPVVTLLAAFATAADPPTKAPTKEQIARWLRQLGDNDFAVREQATQKLWEAGAPAEPGLRELLKSDDAEVVRRVQEILDKFRWGLYPDTPRATVDRIMRYQGGDKAAKQTVVRELLDLGGDGCAVLLRIARAEDDEETRRDLFQQVAQEASRAVPDLLVQNNFDTLDQLLELTVAADLDAAAAGYTAYALLRGKLDERIAAASARAEKEKDGKAWQLLTHLHRAKGDLKTAADAAAKANKPELHEAILAEAGDWAALAKLDIDSGDGFHRLALKATYQRLGGDRDGFEKTIAEIVKRAEDPAAAEQATEAAKCLMLNERPAEALRVLTKAKQHRTAFEMLAGQMRVRDAFEAADKAKEDSADDLPAIEVRRAALLLHIGETAKATEAFDRLARDIPTEGDPMAWYEDLIAREYLGGLKDRAFEHAAKVLSLTKSDSNQSGLMEKVFPDGKDRADVWWRFLRKKYADEKPVESMKRLRRLMAAKPDAKEVEGAAHDAARDAEDLSPEEKERALVAIAQSCLDAGLDEAGRDYLERAVRAGFSPQPLLVLGDHHAAKKQWERAAERYGRAWEKDRKQPLPLFLQGWALAQGGSVKEGKRRSDLAHWVALGDESQREAFGEELKKRGHLNAARREFELLRRTSQPGSFSAGEGVRQLAMEDAAARRHAAAAEHTQQSLLRVMGPFVMFEDTSAYLSMPNYVNTYRARGLAEAGKIDEALRLAELCLDLQPADADLAILLVPALEKQGHKKDADELFKKTRTFAAKWVEEHPNSGWAHNALAWLCAGCRRDLDTALAHARKAVELQPDSAGNLDTLAEAHFQRGDRDRAIELMKKCIAMNGKSTYFRKQLERLEKGDRTAELPPEDE